MKLTLFTIIFLVISPLLSVTHPQDLGTRFGILKQQGISYVSYRQGQYSDPDSDLVLTKLHDIGASWISLIVTQYQETITSTTIYKTNATPFDDDLIHVINQAHSLGLKVMLKPHVNLTSDPTHWRGQIGKGFTEVQWTSWFASYQTFIEHYAQLAQTYGVDQFCTGTELNSTQSRTAQWRGLLKSIRSIYNGPITYAVIWGNEAFINWWDAVDFIGIDAYYPLTNKNNPTIAELNAGWTSYTTALANLSSIWNKKILFTEIGYRSQDGANQHPWDYRSEGLIDLQEQANAYQAVFESVFNQSWFAGMYWWSWGPNPFEGGACDDNYSPHDKPAEDILLSWYGGKQKTISITPQADYGRVLPIFKDGLSVGWADWSRGSTINLLTPYPEINRKQAMFATIQPWGVISFHYENMNTSPYYWLEFQVLQVTSSQHLQVNANDQNDKILRRVPACINIAGSTIQPGIWSRVRISLADMNASNILIQRIEIMNYSSQTAQLWIDEIQMVPSY